MGSFHRVLIQCETWTARMAFKRGRRGSPLALALAVAAVAGSVQFRLFVGVLSRHSATARSLVARRAEEESAALVTPYRSAALVKVEEDIESRLKVAEEENDSKKITQLARLLVMAKASEGAAAWQSTKELSEAVGNQMADTLSEFVGKDDYDINDVADEVDKRVGAAVATLDNVYLTKEAAESAGAKDYVLVKDVVAPVAENMKESAEGAVLAFTGKEEYKFGDISKEAASRAGTAIANVLGKEEYQFGDISKAAAGKVMDGIKSFTGKEDYQFGDITKTVLINALNFLEGDDKNKEKK